MSKALKEMLTRARKAAKAYLGNEVSLTLTFHNQDERYRLWFNYRGFSGFVFLEDDNNPDPMAFGAMLVALQTASQDRAKLQG